MAQSSLKWDILNPTLLDALLARPCTTRERAQYLAAKLHLLSSSHDANDVLLLETRIALSRAYIADQAWVEAESELSGLLDRTKRILKHCSSGEVVQLRRATLEMLMVVDDALGREGRVKRWKAMLDGMQGAG